MLRLQRVEISGFKSFYEKVDLAFPGDVTAVVGPNGCGKSNICDAVAWALGEQSARILRGERMDDVIFNGSARRRPVGMAEVILTLSRRDGNGAALEGDESEEPLRIGRRVYREGHGEYFLNDRQVRLKDIQDRLLGTGLGVRAYSVIEQGRIDQVLSTKPQDRRRLIEEAAGISKYRLKKRLAETRLEETRGNLLRLSDILSEIERNVASLKRQASRAARYKEQSEALRLRRTALLRVRHDALESALSEALRVRDSHRDSEAQAAASLARAESDLASARLDSEHAAEARDRARETVLSIEAAIQREETLLEANRRAAAELAARREALEREGRDNAVEQERAARELADSEARLERAVAESRVRSLAREDADRKAAEAGTAFGGLEAELERARSDALASAGERVNARNASHELELSAERLAASLARLEASGIRVAAELEGREAELLAWGEEERGLLEVEGQAAAALAAREEDLARLADRLASAELDRESAREALGQLEHRLSALSEIARSRESTVTEVRRSLVSSGIQAGSSLSDRLEPVSGWEDAVDLLLGEDADALAVEGDPARALSATEAFSQVRLLARDWVGRAENPAGAGGRGWSSVLRNYGGLSSAERAALPPALFADSLEEALDLARDHPGTAVVTRRRELVRGPLLGVVRTDPAASGLFALRREREALMIELARARHSTDSAEASLSELRRARHEAEEEVPRLREAERRASSLASGFLVRVEERRSERDRLRRELDTVTAEIASLRGERDEIDLRRREAQEEEARCVEREAAARQGADLLSGRLPEARSFAMAAAEELAHRRTEAEVAAERRRAIESAREKLLESQATLQRRIAEGREEETRIAEKFVELELERAEARGRQAASLSDREEKATLLEEATTRGAEIVSRIGRLDEDAKVRRCELDTAREARFGAEVAETRVRSDLDHVAAEAKTDFGMAPGDLPAPEEAGPEAIARLEREAEELSASIERLGPVNVLAFEEHREMSERLTFLSAQRDDLTRSIAELQESIRKINATSSERFREAFTAINENFKVMFTRLFRGGTAEMRLLDENDLLESGVEIAAQPPGKRNQSILLLSGGEKALTAIALLMAIFRYKPSPFCILDEVDAPLDEANIDRFTTLLRDMTEDTQFIAITHNKRTMETADALYGVTMEEPGCSKIVSVRFN